MTALDRSLEDDPLTGLPDAARAIVARAQVGEQLDATERRRLEELHQFGVDIDAGLEVACLTCGTRGAHKPWCEGPPPEWQPVDGAALLDRVHASLLRYVVFPTPEAAIGVTLWVAATHAQTRWQHATRLVITSPEKRSGKSRLLDVIAGLVHRPLLAGSATAPAIFRSIDPDDPRTLLMDEADSVWSPGKAGQSDKAEDLRGLLNSGFQRGRGMLRCDGPKNEPREFATFCMAGIAGIGVDRIPDTIRDRAVEVPLRRRLSTETVAPYKHFRDGPPLHKLRDEVAAWIGANLARLELEPADLGLEDRAAECWEPLVSVADLAGGEWPKRARDAAQVLCTIQSAEGADDSLRLRLLDDLRAVLAALNPQHGCVASAVVVDRLRAREESPWDSFDLTQSKLANRLKDYGIRPVAVRPDGPTSKQVRGYVVEALADAFGRYLPPPVADDDPPPDPPSQGVTPSQTVSRNGSPVTGADSVTPQTVTTPEGVTADPFTGNGCDAVTVCDTPPAPSEPEDDLVTDLDDAFAAIDADLAAEIAALADDDPDRGVKIAQARSAAVLRRRALSAT
ncbi:MAG: DUF3631 domain-containing protein [Acidimicrobiia bacterium]